MTEKKKGYCNICERQHDNENSLYIVVYDSKFRIYCRRNELKYIEMNIKSKDVNMKFNKYLILKKNLSTEINIDCFEHNTDKIFLDKNTIKYSNKDLKEYEFHDNNVLVVHSNVKTGKTKKLKEYLNKNPDTKYIIIISFRILFSVELKEKFYFIIF